LAIFGHRCLVLGIMNLTPDSFSGGMGDASYEDCLLLAKGLIHSGASHVDIGAESTRPGADPVDMDTQWDRLEPFLHLAKREKILSLISVDTRNATIMLRAAALGVSFINCVGPLPSHDVLCELKSVNPKISFMACHMHGEPKSMQDTPLGLPEARRHVSDFFHAAHGSLRRAGFADEEIFLDPGIGFGKTDCANWGLLRDTAAHSRKFNIAVGVSRKGFMGRALNIPDPKDRDASSHLIEYGLVLAGAKMIRTHDVSGLKRLKFSIEGGHVA
jgi:dihydropteroate synthase